VGDPIFDTKNRTATVNIAKGSDLNKIELLDLKLGPEGSTINMSSTLPQLTWTNFDNNFATTTVVVNYRDFIVMEEWKLYVFISNNNVTTLRADAFVEAAYLYGEGIEGAEYGFEYKEESVEAWVQVDKASIKTSGNNFSAKITKLKPNTAYVCRAIAGSEIGEEVNFTTGSIVELLNGNFDNWHKVGNVWNPWAEGAQSFWDTGNKGSTTMPGAESNTMPTSETVSGYGQAAKLESKFVGIGTLGKFAAGNLFVGEFKRVDGTNGVLDFGRPFTAKPTQLKGYYKYTSKPINYFDKELFSNLSGVPDTCSIYMALGDWDSPIEIRTKPSDRKIFDPNDPKIIAYAEHFSGTSTETYQPFTLNLEYRATNRTPKYIIIVCSASRYGDYFTGGAGSTLWIDNFEFGWD
ncbi:MAG: PCMD domain-containing protein, partial [Tannerellaceae bacterium]